VLNRLINQVGPKMTKRQFYELEGSFKDRFGSIMFWEKRYHKRRAKIVERILSKELKSRNCDLLLDAGCGTGEISKSLKTVGKHVVGLDISSTYLKRSKGNLNVLVQGDLEMLPFRSEAFDFVLCADVIEHVQNFDKAITELFRVGKKYVLITTPNEGLLRKLFKLVSKNQLEHIDSEVDHKHILSLFQLCDRLSQDGWVLSYRRSFHVLQPIAEKLLPSFFGHIILSLEKISNAILPNFGTVSAVLLRRKLTMN
jgi:ubiquinone/menaquinone biosynthesis C-methylase UbiE